MKWMWWTVPRCASTGRPRVGSPGRRSPRLTSPHLGSAPGTRTGIGDSRERLHAVRETWGQSRWPPIAEEPGPYGSAVIRSLPASKCCRTSGGMPSRTRAAPGAYARCRRPTATPARAWTKPQMGRSNCSPPRTRRRCCPRRRHGRPGPRRTRPLHGHGPDARPHVLHRGDPLHGEQVVPLAIPRLLPDNGPVGARIDGDREAEVADGGAALPVPPAPGRLHADRTFGRPIVLVDWPTRSSCRRTLPTSTRSRAVGRS